MSHQQGRSRDEIQLLPPCLDDYVVADSPVRFIDAFVEDLDFQALGFKRATPKVTGRPPYRPADLLKLYLYGYLHRIRSSRRLEAEAHRNLELIWLLGGLRPDFKTIADFRKDNRSCFKGLFKQFNLLCRRLDLFGAQLVAIDGSKFKAQNNQGRRLSPRQLQELLERIEARIDEYLQQLDHTDTQSEGPGQTPPSKGLRDKIEQLRQHKEQLLQQFDQAGRKDLNLSDPDSRKMKGPRSHLIGYNAQLAVDAKANLIVAEEVVQEANDRQQLAPMAQFAQQALESALFKAVADRGYHQANQLAGTEALGITPIVSEPGNSSGLSHHGRRVFGKDQFRYDRPNDVYQCPAQQTLRRQGEGRCRGQLRHLYYNRQACRPCHLKAQCTQGSFRKIARHENEAAVEPNAQRVCEQSQVLKQRKSIVEPVFGTIKNWGYGSFLMRGLEKVRAELSLASLSYNLRRALNEVGVAGLMKALNQ